MTQVKRCCFLVTNVHESVINFKDSFTSFGENNKGEVRFPLNQDQLNATETEDGHRQK